MDEVKVCYEEYSAIRMGGGDIYRKVAESIYRRSRELWGKVGMYEVIIADGVDSCKKCLNLEDGIPPHTGPLRSLELCEVV